MRSHILEGGSPAFLVICYGRLKVDDAVSLLAVPT